jgi:hypothetical protein
LLGEANEVTALATVNINYLQCPPSGEAEGVIAARGYWELVTAFNGRSKIRLTPIPTTVLTHSTNSFV